MLDFSEPDMQQLLNEYVDIAMGEFFANNGTIDCPDVYATNILAVCSQVVAGTNYKIGFRVTCPQISYAFPLDLITHVYQPLPGSNEIVQVSVPEARYVPAVPRGGRF